MNFDNIIGKECYVVPDAKNIARSIIPINYDSKSAQPPQEVSEQEPLESQAEIAPTQEIPQDKETLNETDEDLFT
jgi:hypothetical protein